MVNKTVTVNGSDVKIGDFVMAIKQSEKKTEIIKSGKVVGLTTIGCRIFDATSATNCHDSAEWYALQSKTISIRRIQ